MVGCLLMVPSSGLIDSTIMFWSPATQNCVGTFGQNSIEWHSKLSPWWLIASRFVLVFRCTRIRLFCRTLTVVEERTNVSVLPTAIGFRQIIGEISRSWLSLLLRRVLKLFWGNNRALDEERFYRTGALKFSLQFSHSIILALRPRSKHIYWEICRKIWSRNDCPLIMSALMAVSSSSILGWFRASSEYSSDSTSYSCSSWGCCG
jgi:hypothetical protein